MKDTLKSPVAWGAAGFTALTGLLGFFEPLWHFLATTSGTWFAGIAIGAPALAKSIPWLTESNVQHVVLAATMLYVAILGNRFLDQLAGFVENRRSN